MTITKKRQSPVNTLKTTRIGFLKLLREAEDGDTVDALRINIDPFAGQSYLHHSLGGAMLECIDGHIMAARSNRANDNPYDLIKVSLDQFIEDIERRMKLNPHKETAAWAKKSDSHYYVRSVYLGGGEFHYYNDFPTQDSPLPDVVAMQASVSLFGGTILTDKFGNGYISGEVGFKAMSSSARFPFQIAPWTTRDTMYGYVDPAHQANTEEALQGILLGLGWSGSGDFLNRGGGLSYPSPALGRSVTWYTRGDAIYSYGITIGITEGPHDWGTQRWDFLDSPAPMAVALQPDNGCNCGQ